MNDNTNTENSSIELDLFGSSEEHLLELEPIKSMYRVTWEVKKEI